MNLRLTAIVVGVLVVLGAVVYYTEFLNKDSSPAAANPAGKPGGQPADKPDLTFLKFDEQSVRKLEVSRADRKMTAERNEQGEWTLVPSGEPGDRGRLSTPIFRLSGLAASRRVVESADDLDQYGLATPALTVTVTLADGSTPTLLVGNKAPGEIGTYAKTPDSPAVYLITTSFVSDLDRLVNEPPIAPPTPTPSPAPTATPTP
jgi:hypothetical protein